MQEDTIPNRFILHSASYYHPVLYIILNEDVCITFAVNPALQRIDFSVLGTQFSARSQASENK
jgi:hypothetical protein